MLDAETLLTLRAARETGLLEAYLREAGTPAAAADVAGVTERAARLTARVLADAGLFRLVDDRYQPTNRALGLLATRDARSIGTLPARLDEVDALARLPETMATGVAPRTSTASLINRVGAREATDAALVRAAVTAAIRAAPDAESVVELCGGAGTYAAEFVARGKWVTVHDEAAVVDQFGALHESRNLESVAGSLAELDRSFDLVFWADGPSRVDTPEGVSILTTAAGLLADHGRIVLVDAFDTTTADVRALATGHGGGYTADTVCEWCHEAGLSADDEPIPGTDRRAVVARHD